MKRILGLAMLLAGGASFAFAGLPAVPEANAAAAPAAVALIGGALLVLRARRNRK